MLRWSSSRRSLIAVYKRCYWSKSNEWKYLCLPEIALRKTFEQKQSEDTFPHQSQDIPYQQYASVFAAMETNWEPTYTFGLIMWCDSVFTPLVGAGPPAHLTPLNNMLIRYSLHAKLYHVCERESCVCFQQTLIVTLFLRIYVFI